MGGNKRRAFHALIDFSKPKASPLKIGSHHVASKKNEGTLIANTDSTHTEKTPIKK